MGPRDELKHPEVSGRPQEAGVLGLHVQLSCLRWEFEERAAFSTQSTCSLPEPLIVDGSCIFPASGLGGASPPRPSSLSLPRLLRASFRCWRCWLSRGFWSSQRHQEPRPRCRGGTETCSWGGGLPGGLGNGEARSECVRPLRAPPVTTPPPGPQPQGSDIPFLV